MPETTVVEDTAATTEGNASEDYLEQRLAEISDDAPEISEEAPEPDSATEEAPETENTTTDEEQEEEAPPDPLAGLDDDSLKSHERITALMEGEIARREESARRKAEQQAQERLKDQVTQRIQSGQIFQNLNQQLAQKAQVLRQKIENGENIDSSDLALDNKGIEQEANSLYWNAVFRGNDAWYEQVRQNLPAVEYSKDVVAALTDAGTKVRSGDPNALPEFFAATIAALKEAVLKEESPKLQKQWEAERKKQEKAAAELAKEREGDKARAEAPQPTSVGGPGVGDRTPDDILKDPSSGMKAKSQAFFDKHGFWPDDI